jgi:hypothetical protein
VSDDDNQERPQSENFERFALTRGRAIRALQVLLPDAGEPSLISALNCIADYIHAQKAWRDEIEATMAPYEDDDD